MRRWDPLNERQLDVLRRVGGGDDLSQHEDARLRISARALQGRGLVRVSRRDGGWQAAITDAGEFYLEHSRHPDQPGGGQLPITAHQTISAPRRVSSTQVNPGKSDARSTRRGSPGGSLAAKRRSAAAELIRRLESEKRVTISDPDDSAVTEWRRIVDFAKRNGLVPSGQWIEKRKDWTGDLTIELLTGDPPNRRVRSDSERPAVPVPSQARSLHPVVARLRDDAGRLVMPATGRRRGLLILQALAAEAERRGHVVMDEPVPDHRKTPSYTYLGRSQSSRYSRREGELRIGIGNFSYAVTIAEESPQSTDAEKSARLLLEVTPYRSQGRRFRWADRKTWKVEDWLGAVLRELETRAAEDAQHKIEEEKARADRRLRWQDAMTEARRLAHEARNAVELRDQVARWHESAEITSYCQALADRLEELPDSPELRSAREWLSWAREYATSLDPLRPVPTLPEHPELGPEELTPYLKGWSAYGPEEHQLS